MTRLAEAALRVVFNGRAGCAAALDPATGRALAHWRPDLVKNWAAAPGSVLKPLSVSAMDPVDAALACADRLSIAGVNLDCQHPPRAQPLDAAAALALSCNAWVAARAAAMDPRSLARVLAGADFQPPADTEALQLLALGVRGIRVTPGWLARAYLRLLRAAPAAVRRGLELAVAEGTARGAQPALGGKTGTSREAAWFAGYDSRLLLVVALPAGTGAGDAAPLAGEVFRRCAL